MPGRGGSAPRGVPGSGSLGGWAPGPGGPGSKGLPGADHPGKATAAGGTHPTGMHSCLHTCNRLSYFQLEQPYLNMLP